MGLNSQINYFQAGESLDAENGAPGESDNLNRPLKNLVSVLENGEADVQVRRLNIKIAGAQDVGDGVVSDDAVFFNTTTNKYEKAISNNANTLGIIDVENLIIYTHGEYTLKNTTLVAGSSYYVSTASAGSLVVFTDNNAGITHVCEALTTTKIAINLYINSSLQVSAVIDDNNVADDTAFSSEEIVRRINEAEIDINSLDGKSIPVDADEFVLADSEDTNNLKKVTLNNLKNVISPTFVANDERVKVAVNANGTAPIYACRAWVNFNGTGTVAIRASGNVSSITDNGTGRYRGNLITAVPVNSGVLDGGASSVGADCVIKTFLESTTSINIEVDTSSGANLDAAYITFAVIG